MKRILSALLCMIMLLSMAACGAKAPAPTEAPATEAPTSPETGDSSAAFAVAAVAVIAVAAVSAVLLRKRENA